jgi:hypothetical protein
MSDTRDKTAKASERPATEPSVENDAVPPTEVPDLGFHPIRIKGEPLSETIIRERRERPW